MTTYYVDDSATGANDGTSWSDAWTSLASAVSAAAGSVVLVADTHDEDPAADNSLDFVNGTVASPVIIISADVTDDSYSPGATYGPDGYAQTLELEGIIRTYGMTWRSGEWMDLHGSDNGVQLHDGCTFDFAYNTTTRDFFRVGAAGGALSYRTCHVTLRNCTIDLSAATSGTKDCLFELHGCCDLKVISPTIVNPATGYACVVSFGASYIGLRASFLIENADFGDSDFGTLAEVGSSNTTCLEAVFRRCRLTSGYSTKTAQAWLTSHLGHILLQNCAVGSITDPPLGLTERNTYQGTVKSDLSHYRTGGADDGEQANAHSWEMISSANCQEIHTAMESDPLLKWVDGGSEITITVYLAGGATLNDDDFWIELNGPSEGSYADGYWETTRADVQATPAALTTDSESTWNGTGVGTKQKVSITFTPAQAGPVTVRCFLSKPSTTVYVDPLLEVT